VSFGEQGWVVCLYYGLSLGGGGGAWSLFCLCSIRRKEVLEPVTSQLATAQSAILQPTTPRLATQQPVTPEPATNQPDTN